MKMSNVTKILQAQVISLEKTKVENGEAYLMYKQNLEQVAERIISAASRRKFSEVNLTLNTLEFYANKRVRMIVTLKQDSPESILMKGDIDADDEVGKMCSFQSFIFDLHGEDVPSCLMNDKQLVSEIRSAKSSRMEVFGTVVMVPISRKRFRPVLFVDKVNRKITFLKILNPSKEVIVKAKAILKKNEIGLFDTLVDKVCTFVGVVGDRVPGSAAKAVELAVLAAASSPMLEDKNGRIHILFHGPPASGKQKAVYAAKSVNPVVEEVTGGRVTVAGFASSFSRDPKTNKAISQKGYLAKADGGTVVIEDYHAMDDNTRDRLMAILSPQMENGSFEDSTSARTRHNAATGIHLDGNFKGQIDKSKKYSAQEEISLPYNIITRFDVIMNIKPIDITNESIVDMVNSTMNMRSQKSDPAQLFKTLIAMLLDEIPTVDISPVKKLIVECYQQFLQDNTELLKSNSDLKSIFSRNYKSLRKIIVAHARLHQRAEANIDDVNYAMEVFGIKLKALKVLIPGVQIQNALSGKAGKTRSRQKAILSHFSGKEVSLEQTYDFLRQAGFQIGPRTLRRDLDGIATNMGGKWKIPTP